MEKLKYCTSWERVCSLRYPACNAHAPYRHLSPIWLYDNFPHYIIKDTIYEEKNWIWNVCFHFLYNSVGNISYSKTNWARNDHKYIYIYICVCVCVRIYIYRVSQEECARLREGVPYVKFYRYNPKHLCPNLNGYGDNDQRSLKFWQLLHAYWLPNTY